MTTTTDQTGFFQDPPRLTNEYVADTALQRLVERTVPAEVRQEIEPELAHLGERAATDLLEAAYELNQREHEPRLVHFDAWGNRVDRVETAPAWTTMARAAVEHGLIATAYERRHAEYSRLHQAALLYLFAPSSGLYSCPLAMTDGAARTLLHVGDQALIDRALPRLTSRDPQTAWTSGQWMTERAGGSDVGLSETAAVKDGPVWRLTGTKWFTSAITADMALTLGRPEGGGRGGSGLAMFYVEVRDDRGALNNIRVLRLKDKLGTRQMPTAELALDGTVAHLVGEPANGTRNIAPMLHVTRLHNAIAAASGMKRGLALARDYARRREAFGARLIDKPLHQTTLAWLRVQHEAALQLTFRAVELLGREEAGVATAAEQAVLRLLLPLAKLVTGKQAVAAASETLEAFGGAGYVEDTNLPVLLRDAQVLPIWEGTTNVLSLDSLRAIQREDALRPYVEEIHRLSASATHPRLAPIARRAVDAADHAVAWLGDTMAQGMADVEHGARGFALTLGRAHAAALLVQQAQHDLDTHRDGRGVVVAERFAADGIDHLDRSVTAESDALARDEAIDIG